MKVVLKPHELWTAFKLPIGTIIEIEGQEEMKIGMEENTAPNVTYFDADTENATKWEPQDGDSYWYIQYAGTVYHNVWDESSVDKKTKDFLGIYRIQEEAEVARDKIRAFVQGGMK